MTMITTSKSNFLNNTEDIVDNIIVNKESVTVTTEGGNIVLLSEEKYNQLLMYEAIVKYGKNNLI